ncbi:MAG TPA: ABC transporter permease [Vicinamibacterales bacterium]
MTFVHRFVSVVRWLLHRNRAEQDLNDELQAFVDLAAADNVRDGASSADARRRAVLDLGGIEQTKERIRSSRHGAPLDDVGRDVRYALRMYRKYPGFTLVVVLTLALGIGANTAIFTLIDAVMLRWLPVHNPQELVQLKLTPADAKAPEETLSYPIVRAIADQRDIFASVAGFSSRRFDVGATGSVSRVSGAMVTGGYYETLGLTPVIGRLLTREDDERGAPPVAVISYGYWQREFARSPGVVGQRLRISGVPVTIVGVSPRGFVGADVGSTADLTLPVAALAEIDQDASLLGVGNFWLRALARPQRGVSMAEAQERLAVVWPQIAAPLTSPRWPASMRAAMAAGVFQLSPGGTGWTYLRKIYTKPLLVLMAMVGVVLLIACANIASLLLARTSARQREIAVRVAIGAGRARIVRQFLIESTLLSLLGAALGIGLAFASGRFLVALIATGPGEIALDLTPNWHVLGFTGIVAVATGVLFGSAPALQATATGPSLALKEDPRMSGARSRLLPSLVSAQVALSLVLLVGAGLFLRTLQNLQSFDVGFRPDGVLLVDLDTRRSAGAPQIADDLARLPGVVSTSVSTHTPLSGWTWGEPVVPAGQPVPDRDTAVLVGAAPRFFATMRILLLAGRECSDHDSQDAPGVAIVNERFAQRYFGGRNPVGQHLSAKFRDRIKDLEVVGFARNTSASSVRKAPPLMVYVCYAQLPREFPSTLEIRAAGAHGEVASALRHALQQRLPDATIEVRPLAAQVSATMVQERMMATLAAAFGLLALMLACIGVYGLAAYSVARRIKEIGIRLALGARRPQVLAHVLGGAARLVLIGVAVGIPAAWATSRWVASMLFEMKPTDPAVVAGAVALLLATAQFAAYLPARRAARVDPLVALRHE